MPIHFLDYDPQALWREMLQTFAQETEEVLYPGDAREILLRMLLLYVVALYGQVDDAARQTLLRYARGEALDALGEIHDVVRLPARPAELTLRFTLSQVMAQTVYVPMGTRATQGADLFFATVEPLSIPPGEAWGQVRARCTVDGAAGNGLAPGLVREMVDPVRFVAAVENVDESRDGADVEDDEALRARIRLAPGKYSVAGAYNAYRYWALSAHQAIADVNVRMVSPGAVEITVMMAQGADTTQSILDQVYATCNASDRRPLTDLVTVRGPERVPLSISVHYVAPLGAEAAVVANVEGPGGALETYQAWQRERLGRTINPDKLRMLLMQAGCLRVTLGGISYMEIAPYQVAVVESLAVTHEGVDVGG